MLSIQSYTVEPISSFFLRACFKSEEDLQMINRGYYGKFGGAFLPEVLVATFDELEEAFEKAKNDPGFWREYTDTMSTY